MEKIATLNPSDVLDKEAKFVRLMEKEGVDWESFQIPIDNKLARSNLAKYLKMGCPKLKIHVRTAEDKKQTEYLKLISGDERLILDPCDGTKTIAETSDIFFWVDEDFKNWEANEKGSATPETPVDVYELQEDANFKKMFNSLNSDTEKLCLTQDQIINFIKKYKNWLRTDGYATFFPFKSKENFFVASVRFYSNGRLRVIVCRFARSVAWYAGRGYRVVVPATGLTL